VSLEWVEKDAAGVVGIIILYTHGIPTSTLIALDIAGNAIVFGIIPLLILFKRDVRDLFFKR
jgi:hypothetical protein